MSPQLLHSELVNPNELKHLFEHFLHERRSLDPFLKHSGAYLFGDYEGFRLFLGRILQVIEYHSDAPEEERLI